MGVGSREGVASLAKKMTPQWRIAFLMTDDLIQWGELERRLSVVSFD